MEVTGPAKFWQERFQQFGHTGTVDKFIFAYDQPQRLNEVSRALEKLNIPIGKNTKILDVGCGTGDFISLFIEKGALNVTGIDFVGEVIKLAQKRFAAQKNVQLFQMSVEDMNFPPESFNLVIGINVLQHIIDEKGFSLALDKIMKTLIPGGHFLAMDFSPPRVKERNPSPYVVYRSKTEYIQALESRGAKLSGEFGLPRIGVRLFPVLRKLIDSPAKLSTRYYFSIMKLLKLVTFAFSKPFDYLLFPFPANYTDMRILVFQKTPVTVSPADN